MNNTSSDFGKLYQSLYNSYKYTFHELKGAQVQENVKKIWNNAKEKFKRDKIEFSIYINDRILELNVRLNEKKTNFFSPIKVRLKIIFYIFIHI